MKRMVKNGDLLDVSEDGTLTVAGKPIGGGGDREITLTMPYSSGDTSSNKKLYIDDETYNNILNFYYEKIKLIFNDGEPIGTFQLFNFNERKYSNSEKGYFAATVDSPSASYGAWYGTLKSWRFNVKIDLYFDNIGKYLYINRYDELVLPILDKSKFDELYKLADKPTGDGTYVLKATVSGGAVTYTWVAE